MSVLARGVVLLGLFAIVSRAQADGPHHLVPEATQFLRSVFAGDTAIARTYVRPHADLVRSIGVARAAYDRNVEAMLAAGPDARTLENVVIEEVAWHPESRETFARVRATYTGLEGTFAIVLYFSLGKLGWMYTALEYAPTEQPAEFTRWY